MEKKNEQYELLQKLEALDIPCSKPIDFGTLKDSSVYMLLSYLEGESAEEAVSKMSNEEAFELGIEAGRILHTLHYIQIPKEQVSWWDRYQKKMIRKIENFEKCEYQLEKSKEIIQYYKEHSYLMKNRPLVFNHGDYHVGNMIVHQGKVGIIDFDKNFVGDPYDEFKPFCWNVYASEYFETGLINGYFNNCILDDFFPILKFYAVESLVSHLPWATTFGEVEIKTAYKAAESIFEWYDDLRLDIPTWYKGIIK